MGKAKAIDSQKISPEGDIFLSKHHTETTYLPNSELWNRVNGEFLKKYIDILPERAVTICKYGVGDDGRLIDLEDIKEQLAHEWLGVITLRYHNHSNPDFRTWIFCAAESYYRGYYQYEIPVSYESRFVSERNYDPQGRLASSRVTERELLLPWMIEMLAHKNTCERAEVLQCADLRYK